MTFRAKELLADQKTVIERLLGRSLGEDEAISIRSVGSDAAPEWLRQSWRARRRLASIGFRWKRSMWRLRLRGGRAVRTFSPWPDDSGRSGYQHPDFCSAP